MSQFGQWKNKRHVSGGAMKGKAKKMLGCETLTCKFMEMYRVELKQPKTGQACPKCKNKTIRLFDSNAEFTRFQELRILANSGHIENLVCQPRFDLKTVHFETSEPVKVCQYVADFQYDEKDETIVEDVKGDVVTDIASLKLKWFELQYNIPVRITTR